MKDAWVSRLRETYSIEETDNPDRLAARLDLALPNIREATSAVFWDLDPHVHGVSWWADTVDERRRILIGDHLLQSLVGVSRNLIEARIHLIEAEDYVDRESDHVNRLLRAGIGTGQILGAPENAWEEIASVISDTHIVGFLRAVGSTFDCLGTAAVAMLAIPRGLFRCDWKAFKKALERAIARAEPSPALDMWTNLQTTTDTVIDQAGPNGWLDWALETRNMLVHRPRRIGIRFLDFIGPSILVSDREHRRARAIPLLPRDPSRSEMQILFGAPDVESFALTEPAMDTLWSIEASSLTVVEEVSRQLLSAWESRKATPVDIVQPAELQWPEPEQEPPFTFLGYQPSSVATAGLDTVIQHPSDGRRLRAAGLIPPESGPS